MSYVIQDFFDILVIDMGVSVNQKALALFELSDKIQVIEKPDVISMEKMKCFYRQSHIINAYGNKMSRTVNFIEEKIILWKQIFR